MTKPIRLLTSAAALLAAACAPALDWREFVPEGTDVSVSFPCRPDRVSRLVDVSAARSRMEMLACSAGGATFALAFIDVADPARVGATLTAMRATALRNIGGTASSAGALQVKGMTPNDGAGRSALVGKLPDGMAVREHAAFFVRGLRVYQATVIGADPSADAVETFLGALKFVD